MLIFACLKAFRTVSLFFGKPTIKSTLKIELSSGPRSAHSLRVSILRWRRLQSFTLHYGALVLGNSGGGVLAGDLNLTSSTLADGVLGPAAS